MGSVAAKGEMSEPIGERAVAAPRRALFPL